MLQLSNLTVSASSQTILHALTYTFEPGTVYAIMGPNGSGKSTLAYTLMGSPAYSIDEGTITLTSGKKSVILNDLTPYERSQEGIFLSFQNPLSLQGVRVGQLLQLACAGAMPALELRKTIAQLALDLHIRPELLERSLNEGASGGERKKMEVLQAAVLHKRVQIFDEIDTGVDIDALKHIGTFLHKRHQDSIYIIITHHNRVLKYIPPHAVIIMKSGHIVRSGDASLAHHIETHGYNNL